MKYFKMKKSLSVEFYKDSWYFDISRGDVFGASNPHTIRRVVKMLRPLVNAKTNVVIPHDSRHKVFMHEFIHFCKLENIDYNTVLNFEIRLLDPPDFLCRVGILVTYGKPENVHELRI